MPDQIGNMMGEACIDFFIARPENPADAPPALWAGHQHDGGWLRANPVIVVGSAPEDVADQVAEAIAHFATRAPHVLTAGQRTEPPAT